MTTVTNDIIGLVQHRIDKRVRERIDAVQEALLTDQNLDLIQMRTWQGIHAELSEFVDNILPEIIKSVRNDDPFEDEQ